MILLRHIRNNRDLKTALSELIETVKGGFRGKRIFIKPNLGGRYPVLKSENNDVKFVELLCKALLAKGAGEIEIGHGSLHGYEYDKKYSFDEIAKASGYNRLLRLGSVRLVNLDKIQRYEQKIENINFEIPALLNGAYYINLSKLKTHMETGVTLSLKNQMGLVSMHNRKQMHQYGLDKHIALLGKAVTPNINIIDGIWAMEGNGPHHGRDIKLGVLLFGDNMVEIDSLACEAIGLDKSSIKHIVLASEYGVGTMKIGDVSELEKRMKVLPASNYIRKGTSLYVWPSTSCSGCIFSLNRAVNDGIRSRNFLKILKMLLVGRTDIMIGRCEDLARNRGGKNRRLIAIGNCSKEAVSAHGLTKYVFGCPPSIEDIKKILIN